MERGEMDQILTEQAFQGSGACLTTECGVEMGQMLGVDALVMGTVGKIGKVHTVSVRLIDVATAEVLNSVVEDCTCPIEDVLAQVTPKIATRLSQAASDGTQSSLAIMSKPPGAQVLLDGKGVGTTPWTRSGIDPGTHRLEVSLDGYDAVTDTIDLPEGAALERTYTLGQFGEAEAKVSEPELDPKRRQLRRSVFAGIMTAAFSSLAIYCNIEVGKIADAQEEAYDRYSHAPAGADHNALWEEYQREVDKNPKAEELVGLRRASSVMAGLSGAGFVLSVVF
jgi:hypothetical protein